MELTFDYYWLGALCSFQMSFIWMTSRFGFYFLSILLYKFAKKANYEANTPPTPHHTNKFWLEIIDSRTSGRYLIFSKRTRTFWEGHPCFQLTLDKRSAVNGDLIWKSWTNNDLNWFNYCEGKIRRGGKYIDVYIISLFKNKGGNETGKGLPGYGGWLLQKGREFMDFRNSILMSLENRNFLNLQHTIALLA